MGPLARSHAVSTRIEVCGFGPVVSAARAASLIESFGPSRVLLVGIAGTYDSVHFSPGSAACFEQVVLDGVGAGQGKHHVRAANLGFAQWPGGHGTSAVSPVFDRLELFSMPSVPRCELLVTVCSASANEAEAAERRQRYHGAFAEDMEGFGVALACHLAGVELTIVRGASNVVGDRDRSRWLVGSALQEAAYVVTQFLECLSESGVDRGQAG